MAARPAETYQVGVICALPKEMLAARTMLDEEHDLPVTRDAQDANSYLLGRVHGHNVAITCLPAGVYGTNAAANTASNMLRTFPAIRFGLMVGIGGGVPAHTSGIDIRLGDVVVSQPSGIHVGVVQYDLGKDLGKGRFERQGALHQPPTVLLTTLSCIQAQPGTTDRQMADNLTFMGNKAAQEDDGYLFPGIDQDELFCANCDASQRSLWLWIWWIILHFLAPLWLCDKCEGGKIRRSLDRTHIKLHFGTIASGNVLIKNSDKRDRLHRDFGAICVEMEAAGLMNNFPCLVIRGICDYADSHKNDKWQKYAALTAAAFAKTVLENVKPPAVHSIEDAVTVMEISDSRTHGLLREGNHLQRQDIEESCKQRCASEARFSTERERQCHQAFKTQGSYEGSKDNNPPKVEGTCRWVLDHPQFQAWQQDTAEALLWISADPGCGKSVLARSLIDHDLGEASQHGVCYYFFKDDPSRDNLPTALCAILHQLFSYQPSLIQHALPFWDKHHDTIQQECGEMWRILLTAAADLSTRPIVCVLDALDECRDGDRQQLIEKLCELCQSTASSSSSKKLKFLVTSRPYDSVHRWFEQAISRFPQIQLRGDAENDQINKEINIVIDQRVRELGFEFHLSDSNQQALRDHLKAMEHRTYLWLYLTYEEIRTSYQMCDAYGNASFDSLPLSVEDAYERILGRITPKQEGFARRMLLIIVGAKRPLTVGEFALALGAIQAHELGQSNIIAAGSHRLRKQIRDLCGLFVFVNHSRLFLIHQTAKEFLLTRAHPCNLKHRRWGHSCHEEEIQGTMARLCVTYLHLSQAACRQKCIDSTNRIRSNRSFPLSRAKVRAVIRRRVSNQDYRRDGEADSESFLRYSARFWMSHLQDKALQEDALLLLKARQLYDTNSHEFRVWFPLLWYHSIAGGHVPRVSTQHVVCMSDHTTILQEILEVPTFDVNVRDSCGRTALHYAAWWGRNTTVQKLLNAGANVDEVTGYNETSVALASRSGHKGVVQTLMDAGANINLLVNFLDQTTLSEASSFGDEEAVQMLLAAGADPNAGAFSALQEASMGGHERIVQVLLDAGADLDASYGGDTALDRALRNGHQNVVKILEDTAAARRAKRSASEPVSEE